MLFLSVMLNFSLTSLSFSFEMSGRCQAEGQTRQGEVQHHTQEQHDGSDQTSHAVPECDVELLPDEFVLQL